MQQPVLKSRRYGHVLAAISGLLLVALAAGAVHHRRHRHDFVLHRPGESSDVVPWRGDEHRAFPEHREGHHDGHEHRRPEHDDERHEHRRPEHDEGHEHHRHAHRHHRGPGANRTAPLEARDEPRAHGDDEPRAMMAQAAGKGKGKGKGGDSDDSDAPTGKGKGKGKGGDSDDSDAPTGKGKGKGKGKGGDSDDFDAPTGKGKGKGKGKGGDDSDADSDVSTKGASRSMAAQGFRGVSHTAFRRNGGHHEEAARAMEAHGVRHHGPGHGCRGRHHPIFAGLVGVVGLIAGLTRRPFAIKALLILLALWAATIVATVAMFAAHPPPPMLHHGAPRPHPAKMVGVATVVLACLGAYAALAVRLLRAVKEEAAQTQLYVAVAAQEDAVPVKADPLAFDDEEGVVVVAAVKLESA